MSFVVMVSAFGKAVQEIHMNEFRGGRGRSSSRSYSASRGRKSGPGGFGMSKRSRKFKSRPGDSRRSYSGGRNRFGGRAGSGSYEDGFKAGMAQAIRIGYRM